MTHVGQIESLYTSHPQNKNIIKVIGYLLFFIFHKAPYSNVRGRFQRPE